MDAYGIFIHNSKKLETIQIAINWWMDLKKIIV